VNQPQTRTYRAYDEIQSEIATHPACEAEVPTEFAISLPMPTLRWRVPAYASFAGPAVRIPPEPVRLGTPDRWWALDARQRKLLGYALTAVVPFADSLTPTEVILSTPQGGMDELEQDLDRLSELVDAAAPAFFDREPGEPALRAELLTTLTTVHLFEAAPWYRALAPDFFAWLEANLTR
jgi:hypothetical protein